MANAILDLSQKPERTHLTAKMRRDGARTLRETGSLRTELRVAITVLEAFVKSS
jgi:hypothetical protein